MNVYLAGKKITLNSSDFILQGGEGAVYAKGKTAYKIYLDPAQMIKVGKIKELGNMTLPNIIKPQEVLCDSNGTPIGYTMRAVPNCWNLQQLFPPIFKAREGFTSDMAVNITEEIRLGMEHVHAAHNLVVDANELNFLVSKDFREVFFIDVNSYQTPNYPATAIMDGIRDRFMKDPTAGSDWFSFAVITFQLMTGVHPFRGKHPTLGDDMDARMKAQISVLHKDVRVPMVCLPFTVIPAAYRAWYEAVFHRGERTAPPSAKGLPIIVTPVIRTQSGDFVMLTKYIVLPEVATDFFAGSAVCRSAVYTGHMVAGNVPFGGRLIETPKHRRKVVARLFDGKIEMYDVGNSTMIEMSMAAEGLMQVGGRLYIKSGASVFEINFVELANKTLASAVKAGNVMESATQLYDGVAVQQMVGTCYLALFPDSGVCHQVRVKELDGVRVMDAKFERGVAMLIVNGKKGYSRCVIRFAEDYQSYDIRVGGADSSSTVNFTVLDKGMVVCIPADEEVEMFMRKVGGGDVKLVHDSGVDSGMRLLSVGDSVYAMKDNTVWSMTMGGTKP